MTPARPDPIPACALDQADGVADLRHPATMTADAYRDVSARIQALRRERVVAVVGFRAKPDPRPLARSHATQGGTDGWQPPVGGRQRRIVGRDGRCNDEYRARDDFRRWPAVVALIALAWLSACSSSSTSSPSLAANPSGSEGPPPPAACASIDLRTPTGEGLQLTGLWRSPDGGTYYLRQAGSCVWFVGLSGDTGAPGRTGTSEWTNAFFGTLQSDFTLRGEWADLPWGRDTGVGELTWGINFADVAGQEAVTLEVTAATSGIRWPIPDSTRGAHRSPRSTPGFARLPLGGDR